MAIKRSLAMDQQATFHDEVVELASLLNSYYEHYGEGMGHLYYVCDESIFKVESRECFLHAFLNVLTQRLRGAGFLHNSSIVLPEELNAGRYVGVKFFIAECEQESAKSKINEALQKIINREPFTKPGEGLCCDKNLAAFVVQNWVIGKEGVKTKDTPIDPSKRSHTWTANRKPRIP